MSPTAEAFPLGWGRTQLGDLFDFSNGVNTDKSAYGSGVPFANVLEVITNESLREHQIPGRVELPRDVQRRYQVRRGDILFNRTSETQNEVGLASVYLGEKPIVFGGFVLRGRPRTSLIDVNYSKYALRAAYVRDQVVARGQGGIRANIGQRDLSSVVVNLPPIIEQRAIATALDEATDQVRAVEHLIAKRRAIKQGMMQQLLTGRTRLPGFAGKWSVRRIGDFAQVSAGGTPSTSVNAYWGGDVPWMSSGEIHQKHVHRVRGRITTLGLQKSSAHLFPPETVLMALAGQGKTRGTVAVSRIELSTNQSIAGILPSLEHDSNYLYYSLDTRYSALRGESAGDGGRGGLNLTIIKALEVPFPNLSEQRAIAGVLLDVDRELDALTERLEKARSIRKGMAQELLMGHTRLLAKEAVS